MVRIVLLLCTLSAADRAWIDSAVEAWQITSRESLGLSAAALPQIIFFDESCSWPADASAGTPHGGTVTLPDGGSMPAQVTSFASEHDGKPFLVMALPSVWRSVPRHAANPALDRMTRSVFVHEMTHTAQSRTLGSRIGRVIAEHNLSDELDDDVVQKKFGADEAFASAYARERDLFYAAAQAADDRDRRRLLREALEAMRDRRTRFLSGADAPYAALDDLFLMMEGTANWAAVQDARRDMSAEEAVDFVRGGRRWWTQDEGLAIFLAVDAALPGWQERVFSADPPSIERLLESAIDR